MTTDVLAPQAIQASMNRVQAEQLDQYTLWQILGIWALVTLPMVLLAWVVAPAIIPYSPLHPGITFWLLMIAGMGWEFVVSLVIIYRELGTLRWRGSAGRGGSGRAGGLHDGLAQRAALCGCRGPCAK